MTEIDAAVNAVFLGHGMGMVHIDANGRSLDSFEMHVFFAELHASLEISICSTKVFPQKVCTSDKNHMCVWYIDIQFYIMLCTSCVLRWMCVDV